MFAVQNMNFSNGVEKDEFIKNVHNIWHFR